MSEGERESVREISRREREGERDGERESERESERGDGCRGIAACKESRHRVASVLELR